MAGTYLNYPFNPELFSYNWQNEKDLVLTTIASCGAIAENAELKALIANGSDLFSLPFYKTITGTPGNYDGQTDVPVADPEGGYQSGIVFGRTQGWREKDFIVDYNSGADPMKQITSQVAKFWDKQRQKIILNILAGIFGIDNAAWNEHKKSLLSATPGTVTDANKIGATTIGDAVVDALGDNGDVVALAIMHSRVAANLANLNLLNYWKYTDSRGIERKLRIGDINGITVLINDNVPNKKAVATATKGVYTVKVGGTITASDAYTIDGVTVSLSAGDDTPAEAATKIAAASYDNYTASASSDTVTFTEATGHEGHGAPVCSAGTSGATFEVKTTTPGVAVSNAEYTTYLLGMGALHHATAPVKVPSEVERNAIAGGGQDVLVTRIREAYHPNGFTFAKPMGYTASPVDDDFATAANWSIIAQAKAIPMIQIKSNG